MEEPWFHLAKYDPTCADKINTITQSTEGRLRRMSQICGLLWLLERERYGYLTAAQSTQGSTGNPLVNTVSQGLNWDIDTIYSHSSLNLVRSTCDTLLSWLFTDQPPVDVESVRSREQLSDLGGRALRNEQRAALNAILNDDAGQAATEKMALFGLSTGFGAAWPRFANGAVKIEPLRYHQLVFNPTIPQERQNEIHVIELVDKYEFLHWYSNRKQIPSHRQRISAVREASTVKWGAVGSYGMGGRWLCASPEEYETFGLDVHVQTHQIRICHSFRTATPDGAPGRYMLTLLPPKLAGAPETATESMVGFSGTQLLLDQEYLRHEIPVVWWSPFPSLNGADGMGFGHLLEGVQRSVDFSLARIEHTFRKLGTAMVLVPAAMESKAGDVGRPDIAVIPLRGMGGEPKVVQPQALSRQDIEWIQTLTRMSQSTLGVNTLLSQASSQLGAGASGVAQLQEERRQVGRLASVREEFYRARRNLAKRVLATIAEAVSQREEVFSVWSTGAGTYRRRQWSRMAPDECTVVSRTENVGIMGSTRAGRLATSLELVQLGLLSPEMGRDLLLQEPDLARATALSMADVNLVQSEIDTLLASKDPSIVVDKDTPVDTALRLIQQHIWLARRMEDEEATYRLQLFKKAVLAFQEQETAAQAAIGPEVTSPVPPGVDDI